MAEVIRGVPVKTDTGNKIGVATVAPGHIEIVFDQPGLGPELFQMLKIGMADGISIYPSTEEARPTPPQ